MPTSKPAGRQKEPTRKPRKPAGKKPLQTKLAVGAAGDHLEREADRVARDLVHGGGGSGPGGGGGPPSITALGAQRAPLPSVPRLDGGGSAPPSVESSVASMQGSGQGLDGGTRSMMESGLGRDLSGVRVHHGSEAAAAAQSLGARAFTVGSDVFFNAGEYQPHTTAGRELIAHELIHTVQQGATARAASCQRVQRATPAGTATTPRQDEEDTATTATTTPSSTTFRSRELPGAEVDATPVNGTRGTITLPRLGLPQLAGSLKGTAGGLMTPLAAEGRQVPTVGAPFLLAPVSERESGNAYQVWTDYARANFKAGVRAKLDELVAAAPNPPDLAGATPGAPVYFLRFKRVKSHAFFGTLDQLADQDALLRPQWSASGSPLTGRRNTLDADHFLELQIGGKDAGDNMWLLKGQYNQNVGSLLKGSIERNLRTVLNEAKQDPTLTTKPTDVNEMKRFWTLRFTTVAAGTGYPSWPTDFWTPTQVSAGRHLDALRVMSERELAQAGLRLEDQGVTPRKITIFPTAGGGLMRVIDLDADGKVKKREFLYPNIWVTGGQYLGGATDQPEGTLIRLDVLVNKMEKGNVNPIAEKRGPITVRRLPQLGLAGYLPRDSIMSAFSEMDFTPLSPLTFTDLAMTPDGVLAGTGSVASSKALFPGLNVPLVLYGDRVMLSFPVPTENLSLGPLTVTEAALNLGVGPPGLFLEGYAGFVVTGLGSGSVTAGVDGEGPRLDGVLDLDTDFLKSAQVRAGYNLATDALAVGATLEVDRGRIPGVDSGTITVDITRDAVNVIGTVNLGAPLAGTALTVGYTETDGLRIAAENIPLPFSDLPAVQNATMSIAATRRPDGSGWSFGGSGTATLAVPGATGTIDLRYLDGAVTMSTLGQVSKGPASGTLSFTATNTPADEQGNPVEGPPSGTIRVWGRGTVTIRFGRILTGTAGVELTPDNRVILSGTIALPPEFPVFDQVPYHRELLSFEPPEFPIWGVSVAGVGVGVFAFVRGTVTFDASVGAGVIRDAAVTAVMDLDHPELATVTGHGEFYVPAYAGLTLGVSGGLRARAAVAFAEGEVGLEGTLGIAADASAALDVAWDPANGLALETEVAANVRPKFSLAATASVTVGVDLLLTDVSHTFGPWRKPLGEFGPDMELGVSFPVRWSEANGLDLNLDNVAVRRPNLDAPALMRGVFDRLTE